MGPIQYPLPLDLYPTPAPKTYGLPLSLPFGPISYRPLPIDRITDARETLPSATTVTGGNNFFTQCFITYFSWLVQIVWYVL